MFVLSRALLCWENDGDGERGAGEGENSPCCLHALGFGQGPILRYGSHHPLWVPSCTTGPIPHHGAAAVPLPHLHPPDVKFGGATSVPGYRQSQGTKDTRGHPQGSAGGHGSPHSLCPSPRGAGSCRAAPTPAPRPGRHRELRGLGSPPAHRGTPSPLPYLGGRKLLYLLCVGKPRRKKLLLHCRQSPRHRLPANPGAALER